MYCYALLACQPTDKTLYKKMLRIYKQGCQPYNFYVEADMSAGTTVYVLYPYIYIIHIFRNVIYVKLRYYMFYKLML